MLQVDYEWAEIKVSNEKINKSSKCLIGNTEKLSPSKRDAFPTLEN